MEREMCHEQRRRKIRSEDTAHIKRHRCTVGDCVSDANGNGGNEFSSIVDIIVFPSAVMDREIGDLIFFRLLVQNNFIDLILNLYLNSK